MNYLKRLEQENREMRQALADVHHWTRFFEGYLEGPKFQGELEDYIRTHEIHSLCRTIRGFAPLFLEDQIKDIPPSWSRPTDTEPTPKQPL